MGDVPVRGRRCGRARCSPPAQDEKTRHGEGGVDCRACGRASDDLIWEDEHWQLIALGPTGLPIVLILEPKEHYDIETLPAELAAELGPLMQRVERAMRGPPATSAASTSGAGARAASTCTGGSWAGRPACGS